MLLKYIDSQMMQVAAQAVIAVIFASVVVFLARRQNVHLEKQTVIAMVRGLVQVVAVGVALVVIFQGPLWVAIPVLLAMMGLAGWTASQRISQLSGVLTTAIESVVLSSGVVILLMALVGGLQPQLNVLIPVGSMIIASGMNACALSLDRMLSEVDANKGRIEAALSLGADSHKTMEPYVQRAVQASMIPSLNSLRSLGIVWIPGLMAGMILAGDDPVYSSVNQYVVIVLLFTTGALASISSSLLIRRHLFTAADQLVLPNKPT